ncbi:hypothetical protein MANES_17G094566v8 [Manihot esculenta]|uniref:Uncharacterized protein n=1 Tax=Manihot esculenta TaxID=3983 RepID=A0ACB7G4Q5_MANES|nr:hypothetical protein MANES_17G094566v8 [Manihot esculenta]
MSFGDILHSSTNCDAILERTKRTTFTTPLVFGALISKILQKERKDEEEEENVAENVNQNEEDNQNDTVEGEGEGEEEEEEESEQLGTKIKRRNRRGGFAKLCSLSSQLQKLIGLPELAGTEVVKKLRAYIPENKLQDPKLWGFHYAPDNSIQKARRCKQGREEGENSYFSQKKGAPRLLARLSLSDALVNFFNTDEIHNLGLMS